MHLDDFLNSQSIRSLQLLQWYWGAGTDRSSSKSELLRLLRRVMLEPERALQAYEHLDDSDKSLLRFLLRQPGYEGHACRPASGSFWQNPAASAGEESAEELQRRGFAACLPAREGESPKTLRCVVPQELGRVLAEALNLDIRDPATMLSLRRRRADRPPPTPPEPEAIESRIAELPDPQLRHAARIALHDHAGILPRSSLPSVGIEFQQDDSVRWRAALEAAGLGTFGHLSLLDYGLGDDHDCLVLYQELVEAYAASCGAEAPKLNQVHACGINFLLDLATLVDFLRAGPFRLTASGRPLRGARNLLLPLMALRTAHRLDEVELLAHKIEVAGRLGLVEIGDDEQLRATEKAWDWENWPVRDQASSVFELHLRHSRTSWDPIHLSPLANTARQAILSSPLGVWFPANAFLARLAARHILGLLERGPRPGRASGRSPVPTVSQLLAVARDRLLDAFHHIGALDVGRRERSVFVAASPLAPVVLGNAQLPQATYPLLLVNPDFEVILFPEDGHLELLRQLSPFTQRAKSEVTVHLRITQESVQRAILRGLKAEEIIGRLRANSRAPLPQNVEYSIRNWAGAVHPASLNTLHVLEVDSAEALDSALGLPAFASRAVRRLSPTAVALKSPQLGPLADQELRRLGIHVVSRPQS